MYEIVSKMENEVNIVNRIGERVKPKKGSLYFEEEVKK